MLGGVKEMVEGFEGNNVAGVIEWYKQIYGLNNLGGMQLYNMMKDKSYAEITSDNFEKEVKDNVLSSNDYKSDSAIYKDTINSLGQLGVKIGQIEFPKTEMIALTEATRDLEAAFRGRTENTAPNLANIARANEILNEVWNHPNGRGGYEGIPGNRATQVFLTMEDILYHADNEVSRRRDPGAYEIGNRLQRLMPTIRENPSDEVLRLMDKLATQYYEYQDNGIDASEKNRLNETLNNIETVLRNLVSVLPNIQSPIPLEITVTEEMG